MEGESLLYVPTRWMVMRWLSEVEINRSENVDVC